MTTMSKAFERAFRKKEMDMPYGAYDVSRRKDVSDAYDKPRKKKRKKKHAGGKVGGAAIGGGS